MTARRLAKAGARKRPCRVFELATIARQTPPTSPRFRPTLERLVEELIEYLDVQQPDPDLEDADPAEEAGDLEPSLGSLDHITNQRRWAEAGNAGQHCVDREDEHDGKEPCEEGEPSLGSLDGTLDQREAWAVVDTFGVDHEEDPAESGIADSDALQEMYL